jgi:biotin-(acetyl-CoA carboxylase) ligase
LTQNQVNQNYRQQRSNAAHRQPITIAQAQKAAKGKMEKKWGRSPVSG